MVVVISDKCFHQLTVHLRSRQTNRTRSSATAKKQGVSYTCLSSSVMGRGRRMGSAVVPLRYQRHPHRNSKKAHFKHQISFDAPFPRNPREYPQKLRPVKIRQHLMSTHISCISSVLSLNIQSLGFCLSGLILFVLMVRSSFQRSSRKSL